MFHRFFGARFTLVAPANRPTPAATFCLVPVKPAAPPAPASVSIYELAYRQAHDELQRQRRWLMTQAADPSLN